MHTLFDIFTFLSRNRETFRFKTTPSESRSQCFCPVSISESSFFGFQVHVHGANGLAYYVSILESRAFSFQANITIVGDQDQTMFRSRNRNAFLSKNMTSFMFVKPKSCFHLGIEKISIQNHWWCVLPRR